MDTANTNNNNNNNSSPSSNQSTAPATVTATVNRSNVSAGQLQQMQLEWFARAGMFYAGPRLHDLTGNIVFHFKRVRLRSPFIE